MSSYSFENFSLVKYVDFRQEEGEEPPDPLEVGADNKLCRVQLHGLGQSSLIFRPVILVEPVRLR